MNRQNELAAYDRAFQRQQANQMGRTRAQQLSESSRLAALQANFGVKTGLYDRAFGGQQAAYGYDLQRAMQEAGMAESAASRAQAASGANVRSRERAYDKAYGRAMDKYKLDYSGWEDDYARRQEALRRAREG